MTKILMFISMIMLAMNCAIAQNKIIARQGQVSFFSYTSLEDIKAENNLVYSIINLENGNIAVSMLMNAFIFEKALMKNHFNESYVESDIYPKATFEGVIQDFDPAATDQIQTKLIKGMLALHGVSKEITIKTKISNQAGNYILTGEFETFVDDYQINIPPLLAGNIAKNIIVNFKFEYQPYEN